jgi:RNA polymerase sigma-70 factor, ECF subfamily
VTDRSAANEEWCERLYAEKAAQLLLYGRALGLSHSEAEDVVQETFIALLKLPEAPRSGENYAFRAVRNRALNFKRSLWRRLAREVESVRWFERDPDESPAERAAMRCLQSLPTEQREVIVLKIWSHYTFEEIAGLLDLSPNTVAGRYRYGLEKLRASLKGKTYEQFESTRSGAAQPGEPAEMEAAAAFA